MNNTLNLDSILNIINITRISNYVNSIIYISLINDYFSVFHINISSN